jgi:uncharacterized membrane protein YbhN (UPF0104 family)
MIGVVAAVCLALAARTVDWPTTLRVLRGASAPLVLLAATVNLLSLGLRGLCWWVFLRTVGAPALGGALRAMAAGSGLNNLLVANGGDAARAVLVRRGSGVPLPTVLATVVLERTFDLLGYLVLVVAFAWLPIPAELRRWRWVAAALACALAVGLVVLGRGRPRAPLGPLDGDSPAAVVGRLRAALGRFLETLRRLSSVRRAAAALSLSLLAWSAQLWTYDLAARAAGAPLPLTGDVATLLAANLGVALRATPGSLGVFQLAYASTAVRFGASREAAVAASILLQALQILPVTLVALLVAPALALHPRAPAAE